ncbi:MAG: cardiolipin synthase [Clostridia bacterium]|nr:cardiolipin synthase [Clostridia bacterium]
MSKNPSPRRARHFFHKILNRITLTGLLLAIQLAWLCWFVFRLSQYAVGINILFTVLSLILALYIVRREENPAYKISWIIVLCALPLFGLLIYGVFGNKHLSRRLRNKIETVEKSHPAPAPSRSPEGLPPRFGATCDYLARHGSYPAYTDTSATYYSLGDELFPALLADLEQAKHYIFLEYFIIAEGKMLDKLLDVLSRKAAEGVDVRIIYDDIGCEAATPLSFVARAEKQGIRTLGFNRIIPFLSIVMNHRDHRKYTVIDGRVVYTGGINIADEYINEKVRFGHWKDTGLRLEGAAAHSFVHMFLNLWNAFRPTETDYSPFLPDASVTPAEGSPTAVVPYSDSPLDDENVGETVYLEILAQAENYVYIFTPYLIIDSELQTALCTAAKRGVDVRIVTPGVPDKKTAYRLTRSYYPALMQAGVKIFEYTPGFLHAKSFVCDDKIAVVGTINMDYRSLYLHFECGTLLYGGEAVMALKQDCLETMELSRVVVREDKKRHLRFWRSLIDAILRTFSPLF